MCRNQRRCTPEALNNCKSACKVTELIDTHLMRCMRCAGICPPAGEQGSSPHVARAVVQRALSPFAPLQHLAQILLCPCPPARRPRAHAFPQPAGIFGACPAHAPPSVPGLRIGRYSSQRGSCTAPKRGAGQPVCWSGARHSCAQP